MTPRLAAFGAALVTAALVAGCDGCTKGGSTPADGGGEAPVVAAEAGPTVTPEGGAMNATPLPTASVAAVINPDKLPAYTGPTGSVEGTITVTGDPAPATFGDFSKCPDAEATWGHAFREGPRLPGGSRQLADAVVAVTGYQGFYIPEKDEAKEIRIEGCAYTTRTLTMTFGQRIEVKNYSREFWSPKLEPGSSMVLMMAVPNGDPLKFYPKRPGHLLLVDHDRKYVVVDVYAFLHPLHAASGVNGYYRIDGLPVGKVKVSTTHPHIDGTAEAELDVKAGVVHKVDLVLKNVNREAGAPDAGAGAGAGADASSDAGAKPKRP